MSPTSKTYGGFLHTGANLSDTGDSGVGASAYGRSDDDDCGTAEQHGACVKCWKEIPSTEPGDDQKPMANVCIYQILPAARRVSS